MTHLDVQGKRVLMRVDFNVPLDKSQNVTDDNRIRAALPTITNLLERGAALVLMSHLGRPQKKKKEDGSIDRERFSLKPAADRLGELLEAPVQFCPSTVGEQAERMAAALQPGEVLVLENTRFEAGEGKGDEALAREMAKLGDFYVNDAFGSAHRAHASTTTVAQFFDPDKRAFGFLMLQELENGQKLLDNPESPVTAIIGGAKVSDKIQLLERLLDTANNILIGGAMAYTFFLAKGGQVGKSLVETDKTDLANELIRKAQEKNVQLLLPPDSVIADDFNNDAAHKTTPSDQIPDGWMGLDIGPEARAAFASVIEQSKTVLWNGPMGVFEFSNFAGGTRAVAEAVVKSTEQGAYSLIGGGDSAAAIIQMGMADQVSFVSTGGGAMLEFLEGKTLPGVAAIKG